MRSSESIKTIAPLILKVQKQIGSAKKAGYNPFFKSHYANLGSVMEVCKDKLNTVGIAVMQNLGVTVNGGQFLETILLHDSGEWIGARMKLTPAKDNDPQAQGSAITYARRYALQAMMFIPSEDDDAEGAMKRPGLKTTQTRPAYRPPTAT